MRYSILRLSFFIYLLALCYGVAWGTLADTRSFTTKRKPHASTVITNQTPDPKAKTSGASPSPSVSPSPHLPLTTIEELEPEVFPPAN